MMDIARFSVLAERYDAFLVDLWGVVHDGSALYPGVMGCLRALHASGQPVVFISNAPRRAARAVRVLTALGIPEAFYDTVITSGEVAYATLAQETPRPYYFIGPQRDADVLDGLAYRPVPLGGAACLLNVGFGSEQDAVEDVSPMLEDAALRGLPMECLNPDLEVVKITGERYPCAGMIAQAYEACGGKVRYFGKPYPEIYARCMEHLQRPVHRVLAIGDSLHTDIAGAHGSGLDSVLIKGGILKNQPIPTRGIHPTFVMDEWTW